jgi:hypothetical protein
MAKPQTDEFKNGMLFKGMRMREGNPQRFKLPYGESLNPRETMSQAERHVATSGDAVTRIDTSWLTVY